MRATLIRHGQTEANIRRAYVGITDQPLCDKGKGLIVTFRDNGIYPQIERLYASPLRRCLETAGIAYPDMKPIKVAGLKERDFGEFEGLSHAEIITLPGFAGWGMTADSIAFPGGEEWHDFAARSIAAFWWLIDDARRHDCERIAVICHGGTMMAVLDALTQPLRPPHDWVCSYGCGYLLEINGGEVKILEKIGL